MKLKIKALLTLLLTITIVELFSITNVYASTANISISSSASTIVVGNNVTFNVTIQGSNPIGVWDYATSVSGNLTYIGGTKVLQKANIPPNNTTKTINYSFTYRANNGGTGTFTFNLSNIFDTSETSMSVSGTISKSIRIITQGELEASYSKNNNLSSLAIEGYVLTPAFNKNTLEYNVELPNGVTKIKINASKEDGTASIQGTGEHNVNEGKNRIEIKVTAQNGSVKTYVINATVKELDPIIVTVDGVTYNVVRKKEQLTSPNETYEEKTILINDLEVPALENEKLGYILVGLKDNDGLINLYIYDKEKNTYIPYFEYNFASQIVYIKDEPSKIPDNYLPTMVKINDKDVKAYQLNKNSKFYLFYGINVVSGDSNLYVYDSVEKTVQRYNDDEIIDEYQETDKINQYIIIGLGSFLILTYLIILISLIINSNKKKKKRMEKLAIFADEKQTNKDEEDNEEINKGKDLDNNKGQKSKKEKNKKVTEDES